jgi:hypothetical protein
MSMDIRCYPSEGGFSISISAPIGLRYWVEYYLLGACGYQESGEVSGVVESTPQIVRCRVSVPVVEAGIVSMSLDGTQPPRRATAGTSRRTVLDRRSVPQEEISVIRRADLEIDPSSSGLK